MSRLYLATFCCLAAFLFAGCSAEPSVAPVADNATETTPDSVPVESSSTEVAVSDEPIEPAPFETAPPLETPPNSPAVASESTPATEPAAATEATFDTAESYVNGMQEILRQSAANGGTPSLQGIAEAIALGDKGRAAFPEDETLLRASAALRYQSLRLESDPEVISQRRLDLGQLGRLLIERNKDTPDQLGNMPGILLFEEALAHTNAGDKAKSWASLVEAREAGFDQANLLLLVPDFASLQEMPEAVAKINEWLVEDARKMIDAQEAFPFAFTLQSLQDETQQVSLSDFKDKIVVVDVWGTWCPPCRSTIPELVKLQDKFADDLAIIGVNFEQPSGGGGMASYEETKTLLDQFLQQQPINYTCVLGTREIAMQIPEFGAFPTLVFVGRDGEVKLMLNGYQPGPMLNAIVTSLLDDTTVE